MPSSLFRSVAAAAVAASFVFGAAAQAPAQAQDGTAVAYQRAPEPIASILAAAPTPTPSLSPDRRTLALLGRESLPSIEELAEADLKLAGFRINPRNNGPANSRVAWLNGLTLKAVNGGPDRVVALPAGLRFTGVAWSPDSRRIAFMADSPDALELWIVDVAEARARKVEGLKLNAAFGSAFAWTSDGALIVRLVPEGRGAAPTGSAAPTGPVVQENAGRARPVRTFQDLLANPADERLFEHYFTSRLVRLDAATGQVAPLAGPGLWWGVSPSPDGSLVLLTRAKAPFSYAVPASLFPTEVTVVDRAGAKVATISDLPLRDDVPPAFDAVAPGRRSVQWRDDAPATLVWAEALDGGDPRRAAEARDRVFMQAAPFTAEPVKLVDLPGRFSGADWGRADTAIVYSRWWQNRNETWFKVNPTRPGAGQALVNRNYQGRYDDPGRPLTRVDARGRALLHFTPDGRGLFLNSPGATREGEFPALARMELATGARSVLWQSARDRYEAVVALLDDAGTRFVTRSESKDSPPNLFVRTTGRRGGVVALTNIPDPAPQFAGVTKRLITYKRADGVDLSGTLYLPAGYDAARDGPLPLVMWAYPTEFTDAAVAGQVVDTGNRFTRPGGSSHLFLLTQGYAVLDNPSMPIIGENGAEPNDTYVEQLVAGAQAAVDAVVAQGVADRNRIAVGGHSYGAFMTANLLAHSDLFKTGVARSGAYNRTLTPFGFQAEQRTYWDAVDTYTEMSPFTHVRKINEPILLIHGAADDNSGTFPVQSDRFFAALKGNGATVRYVSLPLEAHGYRAEESVNHTLWEMTRWLDRWLKTPPAQAAQR